MTWPHDRQTPDNNLMRFVDQRFIAPASFLDIGSGSGANARELYERDHMVWAVDKDPIAYADEHVDICQFDWDGPRFDCVIDVNTLCHVQNPPIDKIRSWIKSGGYFFCIAPDFDTWQDGVKAGKDYTRFVSEYQLRALLNGFSEVKIHWHSYPDFRDHEMKSWIAEARK